MLVPLSVVLAGAMLFGAGFLSSWRYDQRAKIRPREMDGEESQSSNGAAAADPTGRMMEIVTIDSGVYGPARSPWPRTVPQEPVAPPALWPVDRAAFAMDESTRRYLLATRMRQRTR